MLILVDRSITHDGNRFYTVSTKHTSFWTSNIRPTDLTRIRIKSLILDVDEVFKALYIKGLNVSEQPTVH